MKRLQRRRPTHSQPALQPEVGETDAHLEVQLPTTDGNVALRTDLTIGALVGSEPLDTDDLSARNLPEAGEAPISALETPAGLHFGFDPLYPADGFGSDADLVARARSDPEAFGLLYERYVDRIYSYCYHRVGNAQDAEDLTARTFHRALDALDNYEERGLPFAAWLFRIAHNLVANWHRDRSRRRFLSLDRIWSQRSEDDDPEGELERKETHDALWNAINRLPADRRDLLLYKFSSQMSNVEIGGVLKKSESAIKSLYFRTLAALRKELEASGWGSEDAGEPVREESASESTGLVGVVAEDSGPGAMSSADTAVGVRPSVNTDSGLNARSLTADTVAKGEPAIASNGPAAPVAPADIADSITPLSRGAKFSR
ncbi:MAG: RNA polymerase sigma factor [Caldilineaceae bacterium]